jgi:hypothetical protein
MIGCKNLLAMVSLAVVLVGLSACEKEKQEPVEAVAEKGQNEVKAVIGKEGGSLVFPDNGAKLIVPPKLLQEEVTIVFVRNKPTFDLSGKDFVGKAYRISPRLTFAPGAARLHVPVDRPLPGLPADINLMMYFYDRKESDGPEGPTLLHKWQVHPKVKFTGFTPDQKYLMFDIYETISDRTTNPPFGLFQVAFDMK